MKSITKNCLLVALCAGAMLANSVQADVIAWWNFEDGNTGGTTATLVGSSEATNFVDSVLDASGNGNSLVAYWDAGNSNASIFDSTNLPPNVGATNSVALKNPASGFPSMFTWSAMSNPSGVDLESVVLDEFTIEALFYLTSNFSNRTVVGRDGSDMPNRDARTGPLYFKTINSGSQFRFEMYDTTGTAHVLDSGIALTQNEWWYVAGVMELTEAPSTYTQRLYLANLSQGETVPVLRGSRVTGNYQGFGPHPDANPGGDPTPRASWSVGRGFWNHGDTDRFHGSIDEVKIHNTSIDPITEGMLALGSVPVELGSFELE